MFGGRREKTRGLGEDCGLTRFIMGSSHSEKSRGGMRGFLGSRHPNGEVGRIAVGSDFSEVKRRGAP